MSDIPARDVEIFSAAVELSAADRPAYLDRACRGDSELRQRVEALLKVHDGLGDFLGKPPSEGVTQVRAGAVRAKAGDRLGRYKLVKQLGEGGCGVVYLADQEEPMPYGLGVKWPQDSGFRTLGTEASLTYLCLNPAVSLQVLPNLSFGAGLTVNYASADLRSGLGWASESNDEYRFKGDGWGVGYNLGALWRVHEKVSLGVSFRSSTTIDLDIAYQFGFGDSARQFQAALHRRAANQPADATSASAMQFW